MIRDIMIERNITQRELSELSGVNYRTLTKYFTRERKNGSLIDEAKLVNLVKIAIALDCKISDLIQDENLIYLCKILGI